MASLGSEAKSLGNGCDLLASGWLELQACSESGQKRGGRTREGRAQPQLAEAGNIPLRPRAPFADLFGVPSHRG